MPLSRLSILLSLLLSVYYTFALFSPNQRRGFRQYFLLSKTNDKEDGITLELTKLLKNKDLKKSIHTGEEEKSNRLALNFEKLLGKADFANQTSSSSRHNNRKEDILLSAELENLLLAEIRKPKSDTKQSSRVQHSNHTEEFSPYYRRDRRDYELNVDDIADPDGLRTLLQARFEAKKAKDFVQITSLDLQLKREHGVRVSDYPRLWTRRTDASKASIRQRMRKRHARMKELFGLRGHPYLRISKSPPTTNDESSLALLAEGHVHTSLSAMTRFQREGNYEQADAIQFELSLCGIRIHDRLLLWTDDVNVDFESLETIPDRVVDEPVYTKENDDATFRSRDCYKPRFGGRTMEEDITRRDQRIQQLIRQRSEANARGEATLSSLITLELKRTYWVEMDDEQRTWRILKTSSKVDESPQADQATEYTSSSFAALLFGEDLRDYTSDTTYRKSKKSLLIDNQTHQQRINELVQERIHLREEGRYLEADAIRRELWHTYNVGVSDKLCQYSVGGAYDTETAGNTPDRESCTQ